MPVLPSSLSQFRDCEYWDQFFRDQKGSAFEWYGSYVDFRDVFRSLGLQDCSIGTDISSNIAVPKGPRILHVGAGNSRLPKELYDDGFERVVSVDFSPVAVEEMSALWPELPSLQWKCLDVRCNGLQNEFGSNSFDVVLDKGFLDAFISVDNKDASNQSHKARTADVCSYDYQTASREYFSAVMDLLSEGGSFVLISLCEDYILKEFVRFFMMQRVAVDIAAYSCGDTKHDEFANKKHVPFLIRVRKLAKPRSEDEKTAEAKRCATCGCAVPRSWVTMCTMAAIPGRGGTETFPLWEILKRLASVRRWKAMDALARTQSPGKRVLLHVGGGGGCFSKCDVAVYDSTHRGHSAAGRTFAILVPPGQEFTWTFASPEGNQQIAEQLEGARILILTFPLGFEASDAAGFTPQKWRDIFEEGKKSLGPLLADFALPGNANIPVLTLGDVAPVCAIIHQEQSPYAGRILVRDVLDVEATGLVNASPNELTDGERKTLRRIHNMPPKEHGAHKLLVRQMVFSCNPNLVQSEIKIRVPFRGSLADHSNAEFIKHYPSSAYHSAIVTAFAMSPTLTSVRWGAKEGLSAAILGLGGGVLGTLLNHIYGPAGLGITCVDVDASVINIAKKFFGFLETSKPVLRAVCADAMEFVASCPRESLDFLVVDINSSSTGDALLCPPRAFVENPFMEEALRCLRPGGVFIVNVLCRCQRNRTEVLTHISRYFDSVAVITVPEDVNEVVVAAKDGGSDTSGAKLLRSTALQKRLKQLETGFMQYHGMKGQWIADFDACEWSKRVTLWRPPSS